MFGLLIVLFIVLFIALMLALSAGYMSTEKSRGNQAQEPERSRPVGKPVPMP